MLGRRIDSVERARGLRRRGLTILELLVTVSTIGVLAGLILPAVSGARETARRVECSNHLRQLGLAVHNYHDVNRALPAAWQWESSGSSAYGWAVPLLPYFDQQPLENCIDRGRALRSATLEPARQAVIALMVCPSDITTATFTVTQETPDGDGPPIVDLPTSSYTGVYGFTEPDDIHPTPPGQGAFRGTKAVRFSEFTNGLSNVVAIGERTMSKLAGSWLGMDRQDEDAECRLTGNTGTRPNCDECDECEFSSRHPGACHFLWADGHVGTVNSSIDRAVYQRMGTRSDH